MTGRVVVVGVGNRWRGDDGAGLAVAGAIRSLGGAGVDVVETDGEAARIVDAWDGAGLAVVVDAVRTGAAPGTVHRFDAGCPDAARTVSSHGLGLAHAMALGRALGRLPDRLVIVGVEGEGFEPGAPLSASVAAAVEPASRLVADVVAGRA